MRTWGLRASDIDHWLEARAVGVQETAQNSQRGGRRRRQRRKAADREKPLAGVYMPSTQSNGHFHDVSEVPVLMVGRQGLEPWTR
jgi:hypothetical protein